MRENNFYHPEPPSQEARLFLFTTYTMENFQNKIIVFDTTLRDGEQSPGAAMTKTGKLRIARELERMNVDVIEAGFAISSEQESASIREIAQYIRKPIICSLARCVDADIEAAAKTLEHAQYSRIHLYLGSSPQHRGVRGMSKQEIMDKTIVGIRKAKKYADDIEYSPEDGARTEKEFLIDLAQAVYAEGVTTFNIPDTVGCMTPNKMEALFRYMYENILAVRDRKYILSTHNHNDKGFATINSLYAIKGGARQVEVTMNGTGERAGNAASEQVIMGIKKDGEDFMGPFGVPDVSHIQTEHMEGASRATSEETHQDRPTNQPYFGRNVRRTESGTHADLIQKDPSTYYVVDFTEIGLEKDEICIGSKSGRNAVFYALSQMGYELSPETQNHFFTMFKAYADGKRGQGGSVSPEELHSLVYQCFAIAIPTEREGVRFLNSKTANSHRHVEIAVQVWKDFEKRRRVEMKWSGESQETQGAFQAATAILREKTGRDFTVIREQQESVEEGEQSQSKATVTIEFERRAFIGTATHTDIEESTVRALLDALNRSYLPKEVLINPQRG